LELLVKRATDETLTTDNWQYILDVCDKISLNPETNTKEAIQLISQRLSLRDANVVLRTLSLLISVAENCGSRMKQEIATKLFLNDYLIKKLADRKLHKQVKYKVYQVIQQLYQSFKGDPSLKPMADAYQIMIIQYKQYDISGAGPDKPAKNQMTKQDKLEEDQELDRVLKLSLQEYEKEQSYKKNYLNTKPLPETKDDDDVLPAQPELQLKKSNTNVSHSSQQPQTIATVSKVRALYDLISYEPDELSFRKGDVINVIESVYRDWWKGSLPSGKSGIFPLNYVTPVVTKSPQELQNELNIENKILSVDLRKVEKLLALLSSNPNSINEDEITSLYNEIIPIRPDIAKSIDKYSVRKEELSLLHNELNSEIKTYNELVDNLINRRHSSSQVPSIPNYNSPYPSQQFTNPNSHFSNPSIQSYNELQLQPTSTGFGNA
ncbi:hypothetical protein HYPBUDRAFT_90494, partial [Hyphopichia burtonii NRRL Y-1933]